MSRVTTKHGDQDSVAEGRTWTAWHRTQSPETKAHEYGQLISDKGAQMGQRRKMIPNNGRPEADERSHTHLTHYPEIYS